MYKKILVAFDGSEHATWALERAIQLAKRDGAEILVYHAIKHNFRTARNIPILFLPGDNPNFLNDQFGLDPAAEQAVYESHKRLGERILAEAKKKADESSVKSSIELVENLGPVDAAKELVDSRDIDLVVVGARGIHNAVERFFLGSVSSGIVNNVCCDILILRTACSA